MIKRKLNSEESGAITLEACIVLPIFMFLVLLLYSFFMIYAAQGKIESVALRTAQSMSVDTYVTENMTTAEHWYESDNLNDFATMFAWSSKLRNPDYTSDERWYLTKNAEGNLTETIRTRFIAYLSKGNKAVANKYLKKLCVVDGMDGLDFSESSVTSDGDLKIVVKYKQAYYFDWPAFGFDPFDKKVSVNSHMWY